MPTVLIVDWTTYSVSKPPVCPDCGRAMKFIVETTQPYWRCIDQLCEGVIKAKDTTGALKYPPRSTSHKRAHMRCTTMLAHMSREGWSDEKIRGFIGGLTTTGKLLKDLTESELMDVMDAIYFDVWTKFRERDEVEPN